MSSPRDPPPGFVDLTRHVRGLRFDIGYHGHRNFTGAPLPGYGAEAAWLTEAAADALRAVQRDLAPNGLALLVYDAYRPHRATLAMVAWAERSGRADLLQGYISARSRHSKGVAVDVGLVARDTGATLDMGSPWDAFSEISHTLRAEGAPLQNRLRLKAAMEARGFEGYRREWWHFELPDAEALPFCDVPYGRDEPDAPP